ncbi:hypothetical protein Ddc_00198 [Ditylenchus destructor]|nr:hypothetical protein Ddc_00198 [Ditylenchus destructor]
MAMPISSREQQHWQQPYRQQQYIKSNVPYQQPPAQPVRGDRMGQLRKFWARPASKLICLIISVILIGAIGISIYLIFWNQHYYGYGGEYNRGGGYGGQRYNPPSALQYNPPQRQSGVQNTMNQRSGDLSETNQRANQPGDPFPQFQPRPPSQPSRPDTQNFQPYGSGGKRQFDNGYQQTDARNTAGQPISQLLGQSQNAVEPPRDYLNDPGYNKPPQVWPNAGADPINFLGAAQQSGASGVGMRHPQSFMENGKRK